MCTLERCIYNRNISNQTIFLFLLLCSIMATTSDLLKLEEQLKCSVCLDLYTNPKILPCHHSFCQECLERLPRNRIERSISSLFCPACRKKTDLPRGGVGGFPVAFHLNALKEITQNLKKKIADLKQVSCNDHNKPLEAYCDTCETVICFYCTFRTHKDHKYDLICDCYPKHCQMLRDSLKPVKGKKEALKKVLSDLAEKKDEIMERGEGVLEEIREMVDEMIGILRQSERKLTEQVKRVTDAKLEMLSKQAESVQKNLKLLKDVEDYLEQNLKTCTPQQVLCSRKQILKHISEVTTQINVEELQPNDSPHDIELIKDNEALKSLHHIGTIVTATVKKESAKKVGEIEHLESGIISFPLSIETQRLSIQPSSLKCSLVPFIQPIPTTVTTTSTHPGVYRIHCNPSTRGTHIVKVQVDDVELEDTSLVIPFNPYLTPVVPCAVAIFGNALSTENYDELSGGPYGVAVSDDGHVIVTKNNDNSITILDSQRKKVKSFIGGYHINLSGPQGVAITPDNFILVSDESHRIQKISMDGDLVASVGEKGSGRRQFNTPEGIAISPITGQVYIADFGNHRIQVLNPDLTFSHSFGKKGQAVGEFDYPTDVAIDSQGLVYVTDYNSHCIQKFTPRGGFIKYFGFKGSGPGQIKYPSGIAIDNSTGLVYVSERGNNRVSVFTKEGVFVSSFGQFSLPIGITFDKEGFLYVCDNIENQITMY